MKSLSPGCAVLLAIAIAVFLVRSCGVVLSWPMTPLAFFGLIVIGLMLIGLFPRD